MKFLDMQGTKLPVLGYGTWHLAGQDCIRAVSMALDIGYRHIDTAQIYENEAEVGQALGQCAVAREHIFVTTKIWMANFDKAKFASSADESLRKLKTDYVDLLLLHWPDESVPLAQMLESLEMLKSTGKVKHIGVSNYTVAGMRDVAEKYKVPVACNQIEYHALLKQDAVLEYARKQNIVITAYCPLARGKLEGNPVLTDIGKKYGKTASQVGLRWLTQQDVAVIPKAASEKNARLNFDIFDFELTKVEQMEIAKLGSNVRLVNPGWAPKWDVA